MIDGTIYHGVENVVERSCIVLIMGTLCFILIIIFVSVIEVDPDHCSVSIVSSTYIM